MKRQRMVSNGDGNDDRRHSDDFDRGDHYRNGSSTNDAAFADEIEGANVSKREKFGIEINANNQSISHSRDKDMRVTEEMNISIQF